MRQAKGLAIPLIFLLIASCAPAEPEEKLVVSSSFECKEKAIPNSFIVHWENGTVTKVSAENYSDLKLNVLRGKMSAVKMVEPNYQLNIPSASPNVRALTNDPTWGPDAINAKYAWDRGIRGAGVIVAVIDSGLDYNHPQISQNVWINTVELNGQPGVDDDLNGYIDDVRGWNFINNTPISGDDVGHGTHVAGIISTDHSQGDVKGIAPDSKIMPLDFIDPFGGTEADAKAAIDYAVTNGAKVINASWGSGQCSKAIEKSIENAATNDVFIAVAAGNDGQNLVYSPMFPAVYNFPNQLTVGASTKEFARAQFSNYGDPVHLVAPGEDILSIYPTAIDSSGYRYNSGTSMATPFVAGLAALIFSEFPSATAKEVKAALNKTVKKGFFGVLYNGEIQVEDAILEIELSH